MIDLRALVRTAQRLREVWEARSVRTDCGAHPLLDRLLEHQQFLHKARARFDLAKEHGLSHVLPVLRDRMIASAEDLRRAAARAVDAMAGPAPMQSLSNLIAELRQLEEEFGSLLIDVRLKTIAVVTEPISLEDVYLGPFAIRLRWGMLTHKDDVECFDIVAQEPNPASANSSVTHPHVKDQKLCAGDAFVPIQLALRQGRLADAFCLVHGVLMHYNSDSPYVPLQEWDGQDCYDCGTAMGRSEIWHCDRCDHSLCSGCTNDCVGCCCVLCTECSQRCAICDEPCCDECIKSSAHSQKDCCPRCVRACPTCGALVAKDELNERAKRCAACSTTTPVPPVPEAAAPTDSLEAFDVIRELARVDSGAR